MARTNGKGGNTAGMKGTSAFTNSPYKGIFSGIGGAIKNAVGPVAAGLVGGFSGANSGKEMKGGNPNEAIAQGQQMGGGIGNTGVTPPPGTSVMVQKKSPYKATDAILVKGAYDAASGMGTVKYGAIAGARAWTSGVNTVERTVNDSSAAQAQKDRTRNKRFTKSEWKKQKWFNRKHEGWKDDIRFNTDGSRDFNNQSS